MDPTLLLEIRAFHRRGIFSGIWLQENQDILRELKENLQVEHNQHKMYAYKHCIDRVFQEEDLV